MSIKNCKRREDGTGNKQPQKHLVVEFTCY